MYAKLFSSILSSSIWSEDSDTCKVWITLLAMQDREGFVFGSVSGLVRVTALPRDKVEAVLTKFLSPDPDSSDLTRVPEREGRRIEIVEGGWKLLNANFYRELRDEEERRFNDRERQQRHRERKAAGAVTPGHRLSRRRHGVSRHALSRDVAHSESEVDAESVPLNPPPANAGHGAPPEPENGEPRSKHPGGIKSSTADLSYWDEGKPQPLDPETASILKKAILKPMSEILRTAEQRKAELRKPKEDQAE